MSSSHGPKAECLLYESLQSARYDDRPAGVHVQVIEWVIRLSCRGSLCRDGLNANDKVSACFTPFYRALEQALLVMRGCRSRRAGRGRIPYGRARQTQGWRVSRTPPLGALQHAPKRPQDPQGSLGAEGRSLVEEEARSATPSGCLQRHQPTPFGASDAVRHITLATIRPRALIREK